MDVEKASENEKLSLLAQIHEVETEIDDLQKRINQVRQRGQNRSNQVQTSIIERLIDINNRSFKLEFSRLLHNESGSRSKCDFDQNSDSTIKRLATYTKVRFINVNNHLIGSNTEGLIRRYDISGVTRGLYFNVIFDVNESDLCIVNLGIKVNPNCRREIGKFIERVELDKNLHAFFKGFIEYARLNQQRTLLFNALRQKYLSLVVQATSSLDYSKYNDFVEVNLLLKFKDRSRVSPELTFLWYLNVTPFGHVHPTVQLFTRMPSQWTASDKNRLIDRIPYNFQMLVELKGIQIAIEVFVQCIFGHDN